MNPADICCHMGGVVGYIGRIFSKKLIFAKYCFFRGLITAYRKNEFNSFGRNSLLAPGLKLIHPEFISIGNRSSIQSFCILEAIAEGIAPSLCIGSDVSLGEYTHVTAAGKITIGNGVLTGRFVLITDNSHGFSRDRADLDIPPLCRKICFSGDVWIGDNVWLGDRVTVLPGVHIGNGAVIGANSVVTENIPAYAIAAGTPAKVIRQL